MYIIQQSKGTERDLKRTTMRRRAEIDTSAPFRSVKEAVVLFGDRILAGELYANKLRQAQMHDETSENCPNLGIIAAELQETKQSLLKSKEDAMLMANCLTSLQEQLHHAKLEIQQLKETRKSEKEVMVVDEHKFHQDDSPEFETLLFQEKAELQKEKYVTFADDPRTVSHVMVPPIEHDVVLLQRHPSLKKTKKKPSIPLIFKGIFRKKTTSQVPSA